LSIILSNVRFLVSTVPNSSVIETQSRLHIFALTDRAIDSLNWLMRTEQTIMLSMGRVPFHTEKQSALSLVAHSFRCRS